MAAVVALLSVAEPPWRKQRQVDRASGFQTVQEHPQEFELEAQLRCCGIACSHALRNND